MSNLLTNAGFLDGTSGWTSSAQLTTSVDEAVRGAPGRGVLIGTGSTSATNQKQSLAPTAPARAVVAAGDLIEVSAWCAAFLAGVAQTPAARVVFYNGAAAEIAATTLTVTAAEMPAYGEARYGVRQTFRRAFGQITVPANAVRAALEVSLTPAASGAAVVLALLKPSLGLRIAGRTEPLAFDPGVHVNTDLQLTAWPDLMQPFQVGPGGERRPDRVEFQAGAAAPISRGVSVDPARLYRGQLRCNPVQRAVLEAFWASETQFWFVEPDSDRLCVARFSAEGAPRMAEDLGVESLMSVELWLETA